MYAIFYCDDFLYYLWKVIKFFDLIIYWYPIYCTWPILCCLCASFIVTVFYGFVLCMMNILSSLWTMIGIFLNWHSNIAKVLNCLRFFIVMIFSTNSEKWLIFWSDYLLVPDLLHMAYFVLFVRFFYCHCFYGFVLSMMNILSSLWTMIEIFLNWHSNISRGLIVCDFLLWWFSPPTLKSD